MKKNHSKKSLPSAVCSTLGTALLILLILVCLPLTLPGILNYQPYAVVSGSMEPEIPVGSLVYIKTMEPQDVQDDDIIAFYGGRDANVMVTHRVVENRVVMGEFITKGDANQTEDMNPVDYDDFVGRVELIIPKMGMTAQLLTSTSGKIVAACVIVAALLLHMAASALDKPGKAAGKEIEKEQEK